MKKFLIVLVSALGLLAAAPAFADNNKSKPRIGGIKSDYRSNHSNRDANRNNNHRNQRGNDHRSQRGNNGRHNNNRRHNYSSNRHYGSHSNSHGYSNHRNRNHKKHRRHYYGNSHHYSRHYYNDHDKYKYLAGGVVLGALINNQHHRHHDEHRSKVVVTRVIREGSYARRDDIHYFKDRYGNCFEVTENRYGDEIREEIDPYNCEW